MLKNQKYIATNFIFYFLISIIFTGCKVSPEPIEEFCPHLERHIETLASDDFEGRAPASRGGQKAVEYIESEFERIGLKPAYNGSYRQTVPLVEIEGKNFTDLLISNNDGEILHSFGYGNEMIVMSKRLENKISVEENQMIFAGYGIVAPEYDWNDYKGVDVEGKTVVILVNDPGFATGDEDLFTGSAMTYYGRWTYKYAEAARQGAEAAIIVHQTEPASYGWGVVRNSWSGTQYELDQNDEYNVKVEGWIHHDAATKIFEAAGTTLEDAMQRAKQRGFTAEPMNINASISFDNRYEQIDCYNVIGYIEGTKYPDETVVYMGHWDHLGKEVKNDEVIIYNGAVDNATGTGGVISMAERFAGLEKPPKRSVVFMAVTAEEYGLLGSYYYAENPLFPTEKTAAGINMDALNVYGPTYDITAIGYGLSEIDDYLEKYAEKQGRIIRPDPAPHAGGFFRSDHYNFVRKGVPMIYARGGRDYIGKDEDYSKMVALDMSRRYHEPTDIVHDLWNYDGLYQNLWLFFNIGKDLASSDVFPQWHEDVFYGYIRMESE